jgi:hypothetical protein
MPTTIREATEELLLSNRTNGDVDNFIADISKLILEAVGSDKDMSKENSHDCLYRPPLLDGQKMPEREYINYDQRRGYNQAKTEIRSELRKVGVE